ncbi:hypothetical protein BJ170DRAFT_611736 [Xylariales sp. AK1849]|nr:hypothetical protein BJ170DRAFT_611736 [Xylariales sp. AK1849]
MDKFAQVESAFRDGRTRRIAWRISQLQGLHRLLIENEQQILEAIHADTKGFPANTRESFIATANLVVDASKRLFRQFKVKTSGAHSIPASSVLILGSNLDPFGSLVCPLAHVIAAGSCAVLKPDEGSANVASVMEDLLPSYLDREAFATTRATFDNSCEASFPLLVASGEPYAGQIVPKGLKVVECDVGFNVFCHLDNETMVIDDLAKAVIQSKTRSTPMSVVHFVVVMQGKLPAVRAALEDQMSAAQIQVVPASYLVTASKEAPLALIGVTSTEEALLYLAKIKVSRLTYFGQPLYGQYLLKFLPHVPFGAINVFNPHELYPSLSPDSFQSQRSLPSSPKPDISETEIADFHKFPLIPIKYDQNMNFFMQGYTLINYSYRSAVVATVAIVAYQSWRWYR